MLLQLWIQLALANDPSSADENAAGVVVGNAVDGVVQGGESYVWGAYILTWVCLAAYAVRVNLPSRSTQ